MTRQEMAKIIASELITFGCPQVEYTTYLGENGDDEVRVAIQATDGTRFMVEVREA